MDENQDLPQLNNESTSTGQALAGIMWLALLVVCGYTSIQAANALLTWSNLLISNLQNVEFFGENPITRMPDLPLRISIAAVFLLALLVVNMWIRFASLTNELIVVYAAQEKSKKAQLIFFELLKFPASTEQDSNDEDINPSPYLAQGTLVTDVIRALAFAWGTLLFLLALFTVFGLLQ